MRVIIFLLFTFLLAQSVLSQPPTKAQMNAKMQEVKNDLSNQVAELEKQITTAKKENPEKVKGLEERLAMLKQQLAMMEGMNKSISGMSDKTFQNAATSKEEKNSLPKKDVARINALPKKILSDAELILFIKKANSDVEKKIYDSSKVNGIRLYNEAKLQTKLPGAAGEYASTCWMAGYPEIALYIMGKTCIDNPADPDNLNNFAAFLTMESGEHYALPILEKLNSQYHFNSTILNNMGQAWFGLGEINKASLYLDSATMIYPYHSKANETKSEIQKAQGRTQEAIESLRKSIEEAYSDDKKVKLIELGDKDACNKIPVKYPIPVEPLGLEKFIAIIPEYPMSYADIEKHNEWIAFRERIHAEEEKLEEQLKFWEVKVNEFQTNIRFQKNLKSMLNPYNNPVYQTANCKLNKLMEWRADRLPRAGNKLNAVSDTVATMKAAYMESIAGIECPSGQATAYIISANRLWQDVQLEWVKLNKLFAMEFIGLYMYAAPDPSLFEYEKTKTKLGFLNLLINLQYEYERACKADESEERHGGVLPDFDEVNCQYKTDIWIPGWRYSIECNKMTTECDLVIIRGKQVENLNTNEIIKGSVEFGVFKTLGASHMGPVTAEVKAELGAFIEYDNSGIADWGAAAGVKSEIGITTPHQIEQMLEVHTKNFGPVAIGTTPSVTVAGAEVRVGWNSGITAHGTGVFGGGGHGGGH